MVDERINIEIIDQVSEAPARKLREIARGATAADTALDRLRESLGTLNVGPITQLINASTRLSRAQATEAQAAARIAVTRERAATQAVQTALAEQRLATERERTAAATARQEAAAVGARRALLAEEAATLRLTQAKERAAAATVRQATSNASAIRSTRAFRSAVQQTSFQLQDIAVQLQAGVRNSVVFSQQLPQLAGAFGATGAAIGVLLAVGIPVVNQLFPGFIDAAADAANANEDLADAVGELVTATRQLNSPLQELQETYGGNEREVRNLIQAVRDLRDEQARLRLETATAALAQDDFIQSVTRVTNVTDQVPDRLNRIIQTLSLTDAQTQEVTEAFNRFREAQQFGDATRELEQLNAVVRRVGEGSDDVDSVVRSFGFLSRSLNILNRDQAEIARELGVSVTNARRLGEAFTALQGATTFTEASTRAQEFRNLLTELGIEVSTELTQSLIEFEITTRRAFGTTLTTNVNSAQNAVERLGQSIATQLREAQIEQLFPTDIAGQARELTRARVELAQASLRAGATPERIQALNAEADIIARQAEEVARLTNSQRALADVRQLDQELPGLQRDAELDAVQIELQERQDIVESALNLRVITEEEAAARIVEINRAASQELQEIETARNVAILSGTQQTFAALAGAAREFAGEQSGIFQALFVASKAFAIAESIIKIQQGIANAISLPFPANLAAVASVAAASASIVSNIQAVRLADGGRVSGPGGPRDDRVPAMLSDGEFVVNARATQSNLPLLEAINSGIGERIQRFQRGGRVEPQPFRQTTPPTFSQSVGNDNIRGSGDIIMNVTTPDARSFIASESQVAASMARAVRRGQRNL